MGHQCLSNLQVFSEKLNWGPMEQLREDLKQRRGAGGPVVSWTNQF